MIKFRDLEKVREIIDQATGLEVSYAYDDLVFSEHAAFLIQFDDSDEKNLFCYFHEDFDEKEKQHFEKDLVKAGKNRGCRVTFTGDFSLVQKGEEVEIHFT